MAAPDDEAFFDAAVRALESPGELMPPACVAIVLERHYGLHGTRTRTLSSEAESTVLVERVEGGPFILKGSSRPDAADGLRFQAAMLAALAGGRGFVSPHLVPTATGGPLFQEAGLHGYLQSCLEGPVLATVTAGPALLRRTGQALAGMNAVLRPLTLPAARRPVLWNVGCWPMLSRFASHLPPGEVADRVARAMQDYVERIEPELPGLAWQVTHNDPSPFNILVTAGGIGFIDMGDGGWAPAIQDLAIAASHFVGDRGRALGGAEPLIAGYHAAMPLSSLEIRLLVGLMRARQAALILVNAWRAALHPAEAAYINKNVPRASRGLSILASLDDHAAERAVRAAIGP